MNTIDVDELEETEVFYDARGFTGLLIDKDEGKAKVIASIDSEHSSGDDTYVAGTVGEVGAAPTDLLAQHCLKSIIQLNQRVANVEIIINQLASQTQ